jgi:hypothetical protein
MFASDQKQNNTALWITIALEAVMIVAGGVYNIYEIRRQSALVQAKIERLSEFSAQQGAKVDRMTTAVETYVGKKLDPAAAQPISVDAQNGFDRAIEFLKQREVKETP